MAARFFVALALFAVCQSTPLVVDGVYYRDARGFARGQASNYGGASSASANVNGGAAQAFGTAGNQLARNGYYMPEGATAQAQAYENQGMAKATAQAQNGYQNGYYRVPAPATVITYEQNFDTPAEIIYEVPVAGLNAQSSAVSNGVSETSFSSANSNGAGVAESSAKSQGGVGNYGLTSTNAKTYGAGYGSANSNAKTGYGLATTSAQSQGSAASSIAQTNEPVGPVDGVVADLRAQQTYEAYVPSPAIASSKANVNGQQGSAVSSASSGPRGISWRFGTAYDVPAPAAHSVANTQSGFNTVKSEANSNGYGSANANADANGLGYIRSNANSNGFGSAKSSANTGAGSPYYFARTPYNGGSQTEADAQSNGYGSAKSQAKTQDGSTGFRVSETSANTSGQGSAHAKVHNA